MVSKVLFWSCFGIAVRFWQRGIRMQPMLTRKSLWTWPAYAAVGGGFGYWLTKVEDSQLRILSERKDALLEKRRRRAEREGGANIGTAAQVHEDSAFPTV